MDVRPKGSRATSSGTSRPGVPPPAVRVHLQAQPTNQHQSILNKVPSMKSPVNILQPPLLHQACKPGFPQVTVSITRLAVTCRPYKPQFEPPHRMGTPLQLSKPVGPSHHQHDPPLLVPGSGAVAGNPFKPVLAWSPCSIFKPFGLNFNLLASISLDPTV